MALIGKVPYSTLVGETHKRNGEFGISANEVTVKVCETEEGLSVFDFLWFRPILNDLNFVGSHCESFRRQHISEVFTGSDMELTFVCVHERPLVLSCFSTSWTCFLCSEMLL